jgi:hypothetical protein
MSSAVNEVQFPMANGSVSRRLNLRNNMLRARSLHIVGGRQCNLKFCQECVKSIIAAMPHTNLFWAKFRILNNFRDPMAKGRKCNSFLSSTSSKKEASGMAAHY